MKPRSPAGKAKPPGTRPTRKSQRTRSRWRGDLVALALGLVVGTGFALAFAVRSAEHDVRAWLADPPREAPTTVWSGPSRLRRGAAVAEDDIASDLVAAGFVRGTGPAPGRDVMQVGAGSIRWWPAAGPAGSVAIRDGVVVRTEPDIGARTPPTRLAVLGDAERQRAPLAAGDRGTWLPLAVVAMEDARFERHPGIDALGVLRAAVSTAAGRRQGGSTLTQQLAKNLFTGTTRSIRRKVHEGVIAVAIERVLSKDEILGLYLGEVYLGQLGGTPLYGVDAAARAWFGRPARDVDVAQAALITGVIPSPNAWSPTEHPEEALRRRAVVLQRLATVGAIGADEAGRLAATPLGLSPVSKGRVRLGGYAVASAVSEAAARLGEEGPTGVAIQTTLDPALQRAAERAVRDGLDGLEQAWPDAAGAQAALVALRANDGTVAAWVGGRDWARSSFDRAANASREAGSTIKALSLLLAVDAGVVLPSTVLDDAPIARRVDGHAWAPRNFDGTWVGPISVRRAIAQSRNVPAVLLAERLGWGPLQKGLRRLGLADATAWPSAALGAFPVTPIALAEAWTALGDGVVREPRLVTGVKGPDGSRLLDIPAAERRVASEDAARLATDVLRDVVASGTARAAADFGVGSEAAGKTGTTDDGRDAWMAGATPDLVVVVWVGLDQGTLGRTGAQAALPIWARFVAAAGPPEHPFPRPAHLVDVCAETGLRALATCPTRREERVSPETGPCDLHAVARVTAERAR